MQDLWANLMANAMDPDTDVDLQKSLIETLRQFEPRAVSLNAGSFRDSLES